MNPIKYIFAVLAIMGLLTTQIMAATDAQIKNAANNPEVLKTLLAGKTSSQAAEIAWDVMKAAIKLGGTEAELQKRIVAVAAAAIAASGKNAESVASALVRASRSKHTGIVVASIALVVKGWANAKNVIKAAIKAAPSGQKSNADAAAKNPVGTLGNLAPIVIATVTGMAVPSVPLMLDKYQTQ